jgi:glycosyltransferase involved in cell wall biosynthesis
LKVLITTTYWKNSSGGGIKIYLANLVEELQKKGLKVDVIFANGEDQNNYKINTNELHSIFPLKILQAYLSLRRLKPEVIHSHGGMYYYLIAGYFYRIFHPVALVYTFHTEPDQDDLISPLRRFFLQNLLSRCSRVTFVSRTLMSKVDEKWGLKFHSYAITYAGVDHEDVSESEKAAFLNEFEVPHGSIILLALGLTALSYKAEGLKILIKAVKIIRDEYPNTILLATRNGGFVPELKIYAQELGIKDAVIFTGDVKNAQIPLAISDIYTHISLGEGLPIALLEAMSMEKPIVATPVGGIPEAIEDGKEGILVEPNAEKIAEKVVYLLKNKKKAKELARNARKVAEERFTWEKSANKFIEIYIEGREREELELVGS